jgi:hypothetical protein
VNIVALLQFTALEFETRDTVATWRASDLGISEALVDLKIRGVNSPRSVRLLTVEGLQLIFDELLIVLLGRRV